MRRGVDVDRRHLLRDHRSRPVPDRRPRVGTVASGVGAVSGPSGTHVSIQGHDETGEFCGVVEIDHFGGEPCVYVEAFDHSHVADKFTSACVALTPDEARQVADAIYAAIGDPPPHSPAA